MTVAVTSRERVLWPETGFTKGALADYYRSVAPVLVPHLAGRAVTLRRFPEGVEGPSWFQDECRGAPPWMTTAQVRGRRFCVLDSPDALVWAANLSTIELHPYPFRVGDPERATYLVFDLDPGDGATAVDCCAVALRLRARFPDARVKTSGVLGLHVYVPTSAPFAEAKALAREVATELAVETPELVTATQKRAARAGRVLVDWLQNDPSRSTVAPYSLRAAPWPLASTPLTWDEVERAGEPRELVFTADDVLARLGRYGDLF